MDLFVVSRSRFDKSDTLKCLGDSASQVKLVVPKNQVKEYKGLASEYGCTIVGCPFDGIALTRQFCGGIAKDKKFVMFDDDLMFYKRISDEDWRLRYLADLDEKPENMLDLIESCLSKFAHVAVSAREGNNRLPYNGVNCSRPLRVLAYQTAQFNDLIHGRVRVMEDFDVTLQLLKKGKLNHIIAKWAQGQKQTQMPGGCSDYRTLKVHEDNVKKFAKLHHPFVKLRQKHNKSGGSFGVRLEATIHWKKAYESHRKA